MSASTNAKPLAVNPHPSAQRSSNTSSVPLLGESFADSSARMKTASSSSSDVEPDVSKKATGESEKGSMRKLFSFGKKKEGEKSKAASKMADRQVSPSTLAAARNTAAAAQPRSTPRETTSPIRTNHPYQMPSSPNRTLPSGSPRIPSPAGSQIFERDVQESSLPVPNSPAIPSHMKTEDHIPPVLDASSEAITNAHLDPDSVEIVTHSSHQPAAVTVAGGSGASGILDNTAASTHIYNDDLSSPPDKSIDIDSGSTYNTLDTTDVRRLSFISFADVVQSEHAEQALGSIASIGSRDSTHAVGLRSLSPPANRSPSPIRSPVSSQGTHERSPSTSGPASMKGIEISPVRVGRAMGSPQSLHSNGGGAELTIETMSQALKRTGSGELNGARGLPLSPISLEGGSAGAFK